MGTFGGHALPGGFFFVFGFWWTFQTYRRYFKTKRNRGNFRCTPTTKCDCLCGCARNYEIEGLVKVVLISFGMIGELVTGTRCESFCTGNLQHMTMFFFFGLTGVVDLLVHHKVALPSGAQYAAILLALIVELVLFRFHLHGRTDMDVQMHTLLMYSVVLSIVVVAVEFRYQNSALCMLARCFCALLQGTWFFQIGFVLYPPFSDKSGWDENNHEQMLLITAMFAWHMAGHVTFIIVVGIVMSRCYKSKYRPLNDNVSLIEAGGDDFSQSEKANADACLQDLTSYTDN